MSAEHHTDRPDCGPGPSAGTGDHTTVQPGPAIHPRPDEHGKPVRLKSPSTPTALASWQQPCSTAVVIPDGPMPQALAGVAFSTWPDAPRDERDWQTLADQAPVSEPAFICPPGKKAAAGVAIVEEDGRIWLVAPSNAFGGYPITLPKGTQAAGMSLQATAIREAWEETGLAVRLTGFLLDVQRSTSFTRYYLAQRLAGTPADMGWESQAVLLAPASHLPRLLANPNDTPIVHALQQMQC